MQKCNPFFKIISEFSKFAMWFDEYEPECFPVTSTVNAANVNVVVLVTAVAVETATRRPINLPC